MPDWVPSLDRPSGRKYADLRADSVDVLPLAGLLNPLPGLSSELQDVLTDPGLLFPDPPSGPNRFSNFSSGCRSEYVKLVLRQLCCGQLGLASSIAAGGTVISVGKPEGTRQRVVWHGRPVSSCALRPPKPRHLASPSALCYLEASDTRRLRVSKRDASCWFDQLALPSTLRAWMGRPPVTIDELVNIAGMSPQEIAIYLEPSETMGFDSYFPVSHVFPMGFAWSSYVAQAYLLDTCQAAGMDSTQVVSCDAPLPEHKEIVFAAATDDIMSFSRTPSASQRQALEVNKVLEARGAVRNQAKDVNDALNATCVGVDLEDGIQWAVPPNRLLSLLVTLLHLLSVGGASPKQVQQYLGTQQWYDLLCRCKFSVYEQVYEFVRRPLENTQQVLPTSVLTELGIGFLLGVFWQVDMRRPFLPLLSATDASTSFGLGASVMKVSDALIRRLASISEKQGAYVVLDGGTFTGLEASRLGEAHVLDISMSDFVDIFSVQWRNNAHINVLEGEAFILWLRWTFHKSGSAG